jgi:hypothetical protein
MRCGGLNGRHMVTNSLAGSLVSNSYPHKIGKLAKIGAESVVQASLPFVSAPHDFCAPGAIGAAVSSCRSPRYYECSGEQQAPTHCRGLKLHGSWPDVFPADFRPPLDGAWSVNWYDRVALSVDHIKSIMKTVRASGPNNPPMEF